MMVDSWHWGWGGMGLMWLVPLLVIAILVALFVGGRRDGVGPRDDGGRRETPRDILDRRYASGELSKEQYEEMKRTLS